MGTKSSRVIHSRFHMHNSRHPKPLLGAFFAFFVLYGRLGRAYGIRCLELYLYGIRASAASGSLNSSRSLWSAVAASPNVLCRLRAVTWDMQRFPGHAQLIGCLTTVFPVVVFITNWTNSTLSPRQYWTGKTGQFDRLCFIYVMTGEFWSKLIRASQMLDKLFILRRSRPWPDRWLLTSQHKMNRICFEKKY